MEAEIGEAKYQIKEIKKIFCGWWKWAVWTLHGPYTNTTSNKKRSFVNRNSRNVRGDRSTWWWANSGHIANQSLIILNRSMKPYFFFSSSSIWLHREYNKICVCVSNSLSSCCVAAAARVSWINIFWLFILRFGQLGNVNMVSSCYFFQFLFFRLFFFSFHTRIRCIGMGHLCIFPYDRFNIKHFDLHTGWGTRFFNFHTQQQSKQNR